MAPVLPNSNIAAGATTLSALGVGDAGAQLPQHLQETALLLLKHQKYNGLGSNLNLSSSAAATVGLQIESNKSISPHGNSLLSPSQTALNLNSVSLPSVTAASSDSGLSSIISSTPSLTQLASPPSSLVALSAVGHASSLSSILSNSTPVTSSNSTANAANTQIATGRSSPLIGAYSCNNGTNAYGLPATGNSNLLYAERTSPALSMLGSSKTQTLCPLQASTLASAMPIHSSSSITAVTTATSSIVTHGSPNYLNSMKLLGTAASIDLGSSSAAHRTNSYSTLKGGFGFRRSFDDKIMHFNANSSSNTHSKAALIGGNASHSHSNNYHYHFHYPLPAHHHHHHHAHSGVAAAAGGGGSICPSGMVSSVGVPIKLSSNTSYREDFLQQIGYLPTTRIFSTPTPTTSNSMDDDKTQQDFLSLSLSPPLNRRRDMPALRGPFVSL